MSPEIISKSDQYSLHSMASVKAGLEWIQDWRFLLESLELDSHCYLNYLAQELKVQYWLVVGSRMHIIDYTVARILRLWFKIRPEYGPGLPDHLLSRVAGRSWWKDKTLSVKWLVNASQPLSSFVSFKLPWGSIVKDQIALKSWAGWKFIDTMVVEKKDLSVAFIAIL